MEEPDVGLSGPKASLKAEFQLSRNYTVNCHLAYLQPEFPVRWHAAAVPGQIFYGADAPDPSSSSWRLNRVPVAY